MSQGLRYKFNGSQFKVQTGFLGTSPANNISAITQANPGVVTVTGHPLVDGSVVKISGVAGMTSLNDNLYVADGVVAGTSFELAGEDTTEADAYTSGGIIQEVDFSNFCELTGANQQDGAADQIEVTTICSTAKEFEQGLSDSGTLQLDYNAAPNSTVQTALRTAKVAGTQLAFKIVFPGSGGALIMIGTVQQQSVSGQVNGVWSGSATIKLTGPIFVL